jgi:hypothetical protein
VKPSSTNGSKKMIINMNNVYVFKTYITVNTEGITRPMTKPKYTPKHREQMGMGLPWTSKHLSGRWWQI